jgi:DNA-binding GntR family transcriptional regulator
LPTAHPVPATPARASKGRTVGIAPTKVLAARTVPAKTRTTSSTVEVGADDPSNLTDRAYSIVRRLILQRELTGGEVLVEGRLAERLKMSRTPLREALLRLEGERLLVRANARSYAVRRITASNYFQCLQVRERLEAQAVSLAIGHVPADQVQRLRESILALDSTQQGSSHWQADDQVHGLFARASGNEMLAETIAQLRMLCRLFEVVDPFNRIEEDRAEHLAILDAYAAGDAARAEQAVVAHLRHLGRYTMSRLSNGMVSDFAT